MTSPDILHEYFRFGIVRYEIVVASLDISNGNV